MTVWKKITKTDTKENEIWLFLQERKQDTKKILFPNVNTQIE